MVGFPETAHPKTATILPATTNGQKIRPKNRLLIRKKNRRKHYEISPDKVDFISKSIERTFRTYDTFRPKYAHRPSVTIF